MPDNINLFSAGKASYPDLRTPVRFHEDHARVAAELLVDGSIELGTPGEGDLDAVADLLPIGMPVFVPVLPRHSLPERIDAIAALRARGFAPVPHIAARRLPSQRALEEFLAAVTARGVTRILLIGGDAARAEGPFQDCIDVLQSGVLVECGIAEVGFAGYPEGHPSIAAQTMERTLSRKLDLAQEQGLGAHIVTQFSFMPARIIEFCSALARTHRGLPVYVGIPGPASLRQLVHFARYCGVSASLSAVRKVGVKVAQLADYGRPEEQLGRLASFVAAHGDSNVVGVHMFSFGGFRSTAAWMHDRLTAAH